MAMGCLLWICGTLAMEEKRDMVLVSDELCLRRGQL